MLLKIQIITIKHLCNEVLKRVNNEVQKVHPNTKIIRNV